MEKKEFTFQGLTISGLPILLFDIFLALVSIGIIVLGIIYALGLAIALGITAIIVSIILGCGFIMLEPNETLVMMFFGKYRGTFSKTGYFWVNPFLTTKKLSMRARNLDAEPIKVNDKIGNPIMIGLVIVWKLKDTYKAMFEIDTQTMVQKSQAIGTSGTAFIMDALENFVKIQSDAALRQVAGQYAYDNIESEPSEMTLRDGNEEINIQLEEKLGDRLAMAGIEIVEARINYIAYAPEIAAVMLRRQQASAIISAREKIVEGAVSMVKMALDKLSSEKILELDDEKKAAMVSNLLVVLCGDEPAQPIVNTGTASK